MAKDRRDVFALTHLPSPEMNACVRTFVDACGIDVELAQQQHTAYCGTLAKLGAAVRTLDVSLRHPDCAFIEDLAIVLDEVAILTSMGTSSRADEPPAIAADLLKYRELKQIRTPATIEGGDVLRVGKTLFVGISSRTNAQGAESLEHVVREFGYRVVRVPVSGCLHLKTGCTALPDGRLLINPAWIDVAALRAFDCISIPEDEPWAANTLPLGRSVILSDAHPNMAELISRLGFDVAPVAISEFAKAEGGVTCLSLVFETQ